MTAHTKAHGKHGDFAIEARGLVKRFKSGKAFIEVLKGVDFDARHGDLTMVMGPSGSGKSTVLRAISRLTPEWTGSIRIDGEARAIHDPRAAHAVAGSYLTLWGLVTGGWQLGRGALAARRGGAREHRVVDAERGGTDDDREEGIFRKTRGDADAAGIASVAIVPERGAV